MAKIVTAAEVDIQIKGTESLGELTSKLEDAKNNADQLKEEFGENSEEFKKADDAAKKLTDNLDDLSNESKELANKNLKDVNEKTKETKEGFKNVADNSNKSKKSFSALGAVTKGLGTFLKGLGIGLMVKAFELFTEVLGRNQKVVNFVNTAIEALSLMFNDLFDFVFNNVGSWIDSIKSVFENPKESIIAFGNAIKDNLIERFNSFLDTLGFVASAIKKVFSGDFSGAMDDVKSAGREMVDVLTGVDNSADKVSEGVSNLVESGKKYVAQTLKTAKANVELARSAEIAAAQQQLLVEKYDIQAEKQRQIRDNELAPMAERIAANEKLKEVLDNQSKAMLGVANAQISAAQAALSANNSDENRIALIDAQANKLGVIAQIEGFRSEQKMNTIALEKEQMEISARRGEVDAQLELKRKEFAISQEEDEQIRLERLREVLEQEKALETERLQMKIDSYKEGTMARVEAEAELKNRLFEINKEIYENDKAINELKVENEQETADAKAAIEESAYSTAAQFSNLIGELGSENLKVQKAQALIQIGIDTASAISSLVKMSQANPANAFTGGIAGALQFAAGLLQIGTNMAKAASILGGSGTHLGGGNQDLADNAANDAAKNQQDRERQQFKVFVTETDIANATSKRINLTQVGIVE